VNHQRIEAIQQDGAQTSSIRPLAGALELKTSWAYLLVANWEANLVQR
jgi:hypothetical protein